MAEAEGYQHITEEPEGLPETVSFPRRRRHVYLERPTLWRSLCVAVVALVLLAVVLLLIVLAATRSPSGGGGGGSGAGEIGAKCSSAAPWNISRRVPDVSIPRAPPRTYHLDQTYVHLVVLDHLELSEHVVNGTLDDYFRYRIPQLLYTAQILRHVPSLANNSFHVQITPELVTLYLACPDSSRFYCPTAVEQQMMVDAIAAGDVTFDAFPLSVETELLDEPLLHWGLRWGRQLAEETHRAGGRSRTMTLTDVQGMTRSIIRELNASCVDAILLSTDERIIPIGIPPLFAWQDASNVSTIVLYQPRVFSSSLNKSEAITLPSFNHVLMLDRISSLNATAFTPQTALAHLAHVQQQFPHAVVLFSTVDAFVAQLSNHSQLGRVDLPLVAQEIGSSSISGIAADPLLLSSYLNLRDVRQRCVNDSQCDNCSRAFFNFSRYLLAAAHPVQGGNVSDFLHPFAKGSAYWHWNNSAFAEVEGREDVQQLAQTWQDSRDWSVNASLHSLPVDHPIASSFRSILYSTLLPPPVVNISGFTPSPLLAGFDTGAYLVSFTTDGSIASLIDKQSGVNYASPVNPLGRFLYQWHSEKDYNASLADYLACGANCTVGGCDAATLIDYSKLRLDAAFHGPSVKNSTYGLAHFWVESNTTTPQRFLFNLTLPANVSELHSQAGAPSSIILRIAIQPGRLSINLTLYSKPSTRIPEASYLIFSPRPSPSSPDRLQVRKLGQWTNESPIEHVSNSSSHAWAATSARVDGHWKLISKDAAFMVNELNVLPRLKGKGEEETRDVMVAVVLHTNVWSRERAQWYPFDVKERNKEQNLNFRFTMKLM